MTDQYDTQAPSAIRPTLAHPFGPSTIEAAPTNVQPPERDTILDGLVNDYLDAKANIEKHQTVADQIADQIVARLGIGGRHEVVPGVGVRVQAPAARFDGKKALEVLTDEQLRAISVAKPDATMARKMLPGALVEQLQVATGKPSVRVL